MPTQKTSKLTCRRWLELLETDTPAGESVVAIARLRNPFRLLMPKRTLKTCFDGAAGAQLDVGAEMRLLPTTTAQQRIDLPEDVVQRLGLIPRGYVCLTRRSTNDSGILRRFERLLFLPAELVCASLARAAGLQRPVPRARPLVWRDQVYRDDRAGLSLLASRWRSSGRGEDRQRLGWLLPGPVRSALVASGVRGLGPRDPGAYGIRGDAERGRTLVAAPSHDAALPGQVLASAGRVSGRPHHPSADPGSAGRRPVARRPGREPAHHDRAPAFRIPRGALAIPCHGPEETRAWDNTR